MKSADIAKAQEEGTEWFVLTRWRNDACRVKVVEHPVRSQWSPGHSKVNAKVEHEGGSVTIVPLAQIKRPWTGEDDERRERQQVEQKKRSALIERIQASRPTWRLNPQAPSGQQSFTLAQVEHLLDCRDMLEGVLANLDDTLENEPSPIPGQMHEAISELLKPRPGIGAALVEGARS